jgi:hypothetical protein
MNALTKALSDIKYTIPEEILNVAFSDEEDRYARYVFSLDEKILNKIIRPRVLVDANIVAGTMVVVPLEGLTPIMYEDYYTVYQIPAERIDNRSIISVHSLVYYPYGIGLNNGNTNYNFFTNTGLRSISDTGNRIYDASANTGVLTNTVCNLIGHNTILIRENYRAIMSYGIRCMVENEENLQNISVRSHHDFARLCILAVKSYIYRTLIIKIDRGYLQGGQELGAFKTMVERYEDAEEQYVTFLKEKWQAIAFMNDGASYHSFLKSMINPGL